MTKLLSIVFLLVCAAPLMAQDNDTDICLLEHLNAKALAGRVVSARLDNEIEKPLAGAIVELRHIGDQEVIAKTVTDANGHFTFLEIPSGAYSLAAKSPSPYRVALFATVVEVRLSNAKSGKQSKEIVLALGWLFNGCHGGYATVRSKSK